MNQAGAEDGGRTGLTVAAGVALALKTAGVEAAYGIPGGEVLALMEALRRQGIRFILTAHENQAALCAATEGRLQGVPGLCVVTGGPGASNLVNAAAHAWLDREPVLIISGQFIRQETGRLTHQRLPQRRLLAPVTHWQALLHPEDAMRTLHQALQAAMAPPRGPVFLELPGAWADAPLGDGLAPQWAGTLAPRLPAPFDPAPRPAALLDRLRRRLDGARRPVILAGLGLTPDRRAAAEAAPLLQRAAAALGAPVLLTPKAKGLVPDDHPQFAGVVGLGMAADAPLKALLAGAELIVTAGFDPVELVDAWVDPWSPQAAVISCGMAAADVGYYRPDLVLPGGAVDGLTLLLEQLEGSSPAPASGWAGEAVASARREMLATVGLAGERLATARPLDGQRTAAPEPRRRSRGTPGERALDPETNPARYLQVLREVFPPQTTVSCDVGAHKILCSQFWPVTEPGSFLVSNGLSTMGYGIAAAMAAARGTEGHPALGIVGDGGLQMVLGALEVVARERLPVVLAVYVDRSLSLIKVKQEFRRLPAQGVDFGRPDWPLIAKAFGGRGWNCAGVGALREAAAEAYELAQAAQPPLPLILAMVIDDGWHRPMLAGL